MTTPTADPDLPPLEGTSGLQQARHAYEATRALDPAARREYMRLHRAELDARRREHIQQRGAGRWGASRAARRQVAMAACAPYLALLIAGIVDGLPEDDLGLTVLVPAVAFAVAVTALLVVRRALARVTANLADSADAALDEREVQERDRSFKQAYLFLCSGLAPLLLLAVADGLLVTWTLTSSSWLYVLLGLTLTSGLLPAAAATWNWQEPDADY